MKERIIRLMSFKKLTAIRFAEIMGVRPSSISHIMSGRNNPSYDFILKVLENFPDVSPDWFILGKGDMFRPSGVTPSNLIVEGETKAGLVVVEEEDNEVFESDFEVDVSGSHLENEPDLFPKTKGSGALSERGLQRVVLLYNDGTFESYDPTK